MCPCKVVSCAIAEEFMVQANWVHGTLSIQKLLFPTAVIIQPQARAKQHHVHVGGSQGNLG